MDTKVAIQEVVIPQLSLTQVEKGLDQIEEQSIQTQLPSHDNIRGKHYYN